MCRFLLVQFENPAKPQELLSRFALMSQKSKTLDGDSQGDGWGVAWLDNEKKWQTKKSLLPIWEDTESFYDIPATKALVVHARSASFPSQKGIIEFNQPYMWGEYAFVFNGLLRGVSLPGIPGKIGAEKIRFLLERELYERGPEEALENVKTLLLRSSKEIVALNIGLATPEKIYYLNHFSGNPEYYSLHKWEEGGTIVCSERL